MAKNLPAMQETRIRSLGWEGSLEKGMVIYSSILAWRIPWKEEPGGLYSMGPLRVGWMTKTFTFTCKGHVLGTVSGPWASGHSCSRLQPRLSPKSCYWLTGGRQHLPHGPGCLFLCALFSPLIKVTASYLFLSSQKCRKTNPKIKKKNPMTSYLYPNLVFLSQLQVLTPHVFHLLLVLGSGRHGGSQPVLAEMGSTLQSKRFFTRVIFRFVYTAIDLQFHISQTPVGLRSYSLGIFSA